MIGLGSDKKSVHTEYIKSAHTEYKNQCTQNTKNQCTQNIKISAHRIQNTNFYLYLEVLAHAPVLVKSANTIIATKTMTNIPQEKYNFVPKDYKRLTVKRIHWPHYQ